MSPLKTFSSASLVGLFLSFSAMSDDSWPFKVYLDDQPVGEHRFSVKTSQDRLQLLSEAHFDVRILAIPVYRYSHRSDERWKDNCLEQIHATTDDNGTPAEVMGEKHANDFSLSIAGKSETLPACIMTFAYWNPAMLRQSKLLNPQTGEWVPVTIQHLGKDNIQVAAKDQLADHYHLSAPKFDIDLWYDTAGNWVGLDSKLETGSKLRYRLEKKS
jgi:Family of unknown function (DUF6134)